ncbi:MAG: nicotinate-nucleotide--dimethylbenzimidazole phosphoribosyltransferase [Spirochaetaceae bacterium]|jgi:nicotinate-nucleotide--dimethylbenzimidazole phosphoribosyltransferase|nr:nicotinate-nucleotide--dimethylbenzimidazole phosphoribosyltransferase [Spirochaetaceae bacterium]
MTPYGNEAALARQKIEDAMLAHLDNLTKPRGSLGKLEEYAIKMAGIQNQVPPEIRKKGIYVFAGDQRITEEGVSLYPAEVTYQMVLNMLAGGAGINALARGTGWEMTAVDAGVAGDFPPDEDLPPQGSCRFIRAKIGKGCGNFYKTPAMSAEDVAKTLEQGKRLAHDAQAQGYDLVAIGDLGVGNTSTAAAMLIAAGFSPGEMIDRGTGIDQERLEHKKRIIREAVALRKPAQTGEAILEQVGSFDLGMMSGFILGLAGKKIACVLDGFPVTAAAYVAAMINPQVKEFLFAGHQSKVAGHRPVLDKLGLSPVVSLDLHLGEGTGAVIGGFIVELAVLTARSMASFSQAQVSGKDIVEDRY